MPYSPYFRRMACYNSCAWQPRTKGHSWHRSIYMWKRYLHYRGQEILGQSGKKRTRKWSTFKDCHRMFTKTVIILSFGARVGPISTQNARGECSNPKNTPCLCQEARVPSNSALRRTFWPWKSNNIIRRSFSDKFLNPLALPFEGNSRDYVSYRHEPPW